MPKVLKTTETPNPSARRFHLDRALVAQGTLDFPNIEAAQGHPLAAGLFELPDVLGVFFLGSTVTVTKEEEAAWADLITPIADIIESQTWTVAERKALEPIPFESKSPAETERGQPSPANGDYASISRDAQRERVQQALDAFIRPGLQGDGGDLVLVDCDSHNVVVRYAGACGSCPTSTTGTLAYIESALHEHVHAGLAVHLAG
jgi:Fe-S cluster biogenesis protein NfuA